jgi:ribonucleoside-triphosphate reductase (formate)
MYLERNLVSERTRCERFSRIVGYYAPITTWNEGKQAEWNDRKLFNAMQE